MATGMARGAAARGKIIAFGDGRRIIWDQHSEIVFRGNPNIAKPGEEKSSRVEWMFYYKGRRIYNTMSVERDRWIWSPEFKAVPGEVFFNAAEKAGAGRYGKGFVIIEPGVVSWKSVAPNKDWGRENYQAVADQLRGAGFEVRQFLFMGSAPLLRGVNAMPTNNFREALGIMSSAGLYVGPEGGLHHAAACFGIKGVVIFGGFIPPRVTGYDFHVNLTGGAEACGSITACGHCRDAMKAISVEEVVGHALSQLKAA